MDTLLLDHEDLKIITEALCVVGSLATDSCHDRVQKTISSIKDSPERRARFERLILSFGAACRGEGPGIVKNSVIPRDPSLN